MPLGRFGGSERVVERRAGFGGDSLLSQSRRELLEGPEGSYSVIRAVVIAISRDMTAATGNVSYTGVGFAPKAIMIHAAHDGVNSVCFGATTRPPAVSGSIFVGTTVNRWDKRTELIWINPTTGNQQDATLASVDLDGFTLSWTKTGSPTGSIEGFVVCLG